MVKAICNLSQLPLDTLWSSDNDYHYLVLLLKREYLKDSYFNEPLYLDISPTNDYVPITFPIKVEYGKNNQVKALDTDLEKFFLKKLFDKEYTDKVFTTYQELINEAMLNKGKISFMFINKLFFNQLIKKANDSSIDLFQDDFVFNDYLNFENVLKNNLSKVETEFNHLIKEKSRMLPIELDQLMTNLFVKESLNSFIVLKHTLLVSDNYSEFEKVNFDPSFSDMLDTSNKLSIFGKFDFSDISMFYLMIVYAKYVGTVFTKARFQNNETCFTRGLKEHLVLVNECIKEYEED